MKKLLILSAFCLGVGVTGAQAGCLAGAAAGGVVGHMAGHHGVVGAAVGCAIGHHESNKAKRDSNNANTTNNGH